MVVLASLPTNVLGQSSPRKVIDNGLIHAEVYLPDPVNGFYKGTRFDWSGVIGNLTSSGHTFYAPWFNKTDARISNFVYQGQGIVAGPCSAITGPVEEFISSEGALGYAEAKSGGTFVKVGVGVLRKPDDAKYDHYRLYEIVDSGNWKVKASHLAITFTQRINDKASGIGYLYRKTIRLVPGTHQMIIEHSLKNIGVRPIETNVYDHNFLVLDQQTTGPDFVLRVPFAIEPKRPINTDLGAIRDNSIFYKKNLEGQDEFTVSFGGFSEKPDDYNITIENATQNARVNIIGDRPLERMLLWSIRSVMSIEPFIHLSIQKGQETTWKYTYSYDSITSDTKK